MGNSPDKHWQTKFFLRSDIPGIKVKEVDWASASDPTPRLDYNCVGFAVGVLKWWERLDIREGRLLNPYAYWPPGIPNDLKIETYVAAVGTAGFKECSKAEWDTAATRRIVLYHNSGEFTHASLYVTASVWKSKFGEYSDIEHHPDATGDYYGPGRVYLKM